MYLLKRDDSRLRFDAKFNLQFSLSFLFWHHCIMVAIIIGQFLSLFDCPNGSYYTICSEMYEIYRLKSISDMKTIKEIFWREGDFVLTSNNDAQRLDHTNDLINLMFRMQLPLSRERYY